MVACDNPEVSVTLLLNLFFSILLLFGFLSVLMFCFAVQDRVVPLWMRRLERAAEGEVVLRELQFVPKEAERQVRFVYGLYARRK
jgi:hypothetical protein